MTKQRNVHVPVKLNRNFLNFPLARDQRTKAEWFQDSKTGNWAADLPGGPQVKPIEDVFKMILIDERKDDPAAQGSFLLFVVRKSPRVC